MKKLYSKKLGGEAFALDAAQLDTLKKAGYYNSMLDVLDLAYLTVNHEKIPPNVLKEWVKLITDELSQISKIKRSDKARA